MGQALTVARWAVAFAVLAARPMVSQTGNAEAMLAARHNASVAEHAVEGAVVAQPPPSLTAALQASLASAGIAFTGEVLAIEHTPGAVVVRWRVEEAVRGVSSGDLFEQREWPGLWADGNARYLVGERALVLLHTPSAGGYASPVGDGIVPLHGDAVTGTLDLRWLAQGVLATDEPRLRPMLALRTAGGDIPLAAALQAHAAEAAFAAHPRVMEGGNGDAGSIAVRVSEAPDEPNAHVDGAMILGMLHAWQRAEATGR